MKATSVDHITSNEQHVRLMIYAGDLPANEATQELLRIEKAQHAATRRKLDEMYKLLGGEQ